MSRKKKPTGQNKYVKVEKKFFEEIIGLLYEAEEHADYDFGWSKTDEYLERVKKAAGKAEDILI